MNEMKKTKKQLIILGHPNPDSYCARLAQAYFEGVTEMERDIELLALHKLTFDPILHASKALDQPLEDDLLDAQKQIKNADHLIFIYPTWWGVMPGLMKGFLERILTQGFAFQHHPEKLLWDKLLAGRTAHIITTMSTPTWFYRMFYQDCGIQVMKKTILGFSGIKTTRITRIGKIHKLSTEQREQWIERVQDMGRAPVPV